MLCESFSETCLLRSFSWLVVFSVRPMPDAQFSPEALHRGSSVSLLASAVLSCVSVAFVGSYSGDLIAVFGWFVGLFSTYVQERDVNKHTQQVRARIAWYVGNFRRGFILDFPLFSVAYIVCPVRDCKCFLWQKSGASSVALRRREFVRHAAACRPWVAMARASLWLFLACDLWPKAVVCVVLLYVFR